MPQAAAWTPENEPDTNPIGLSRETVSAIAPRLDEHVALGLGLDA